MPLKVCSVKRKQCKNVSMYLLGYSIQDTFAPFMPFSEPETADSGLPVQLAVAFMAWKYNSRFTIFFNASQDLGRAIPTPPRKLCSKVP